MERELPLYENNTMRGHIVCRDEGCYMTFSIDVPLWGSGVKKVWLFSDNGAKLLLGTLAPERQRLRLKRRLSHSALRCCGMTAPSQGQVNPKAESDSWRSIKTLRTTDPVLSAGLAALSQGYWRREGGQLELRLPWSVGQPVPLIALFCLACPQDGWWLVTIPERAEASCPKSTDG